MGNKKKVGKDRCDKFYHLAKDQGYRARSAFKLVQLAKKNDFLSNARVCIDLCGAPGSWAQVAVKNMPRHPSTKIICVDLMPIKPLPGVTSIQCDITQPKMRVILKKELDGRLADVVLNDGAPNVGANWSKDAYVQNELTLHATKLASEFLRQGGTYVTKVFRSSDYTSLLWVFQQLFHKVEATKPQASRNVSAEIFVICTGYKANKNDPKLFDPSYVFQMEEDISKEMKNDKKQTSSLADLIKYQCKKNRSGYEDNLLAKSMPLLEFVKCTNPAQVLTSYTKLTYEDDESKALVAKMRPDHVHYLEDLKLLGKVELTKVIKWRLLLRREFDRKKREVLKKEKEALQSEIKQGEGEDDKLDRELESLIEEKKQGEKRERKKERELKKKQEWRKKMSMGNHFLGISNEPDLFQGGIGFEEGELDVYSSSEEGEEEYVRKTVLIIDDGTEEAEMERLALEEAQQVMFQKAEQEKMHKNQLQMKARIEKERRREKKFREWGEEMQGFNAQIDVQAQAMQEGESDSDSEGGALGYNAEDKEGSEEEEKEGSEEGETEEGGKEAGREVQTEVGKPKVKKKKGKKIVAEEVISTEDEIKSQRWFSQGLFGGILDQAEMDSVVQEKEEESDSDSASFGLSDKDLPQIPLCDKKKRQLKRRREREREEKLKKRDSKQVEEGVVVEKDTGFDVVPSTRDFDEERDLLPGQVHLQKPGTKEEMVATQALGHLMIRKKDRMKLLDSAYNRYNYDDEDLDLPDWFKEEEDKHNKPELPVTKEMMDQFRAKMKEINARPIRKVAEAKHRNKKRLELRMQKVRKEAKRLSGDPDMSAGAKARNMERIMKKANREGKKSATLMAIKKSGGSKNVTQGKSTSGGKVKVVDKRLKKDKKAESRQAKKKKGKCAVKKSGKKKR